MWLAEGHKSLRVRFTFPFSLLFRVFSSFVPISDVKGQRSKVSLSNFDIKQLLGKGAFGEVYLVEHKATSRKMALKQMDKKLIEMQGKQEHVKNEKRVLIKGKSDFLVKMHYSFQTKECLYLAMEYCPGGDLREFLEAIGSIEEEESVLWFSEMIMAVHTLHTLGYIHRDLKPDVLVYFSVHSGIKFVHAKELSY